MITHDRDHNVWRLKKVRRRSILSLILSQIWINYGGNVHQNKKLQLTHQVGKDLGQVRHWPGSADFPTRKQVYSQLSAYINGKADEAFNKKQEKAAAGQKKKAVNERRSKYTSNPPAVAKPGAVVYIAFVYRPQGRC